MSRKTKALEFADETYNITITGRHVEVTDSMKDYAMEKIFKIERFSNRILDVVVTMDIQKINHIVDIVMKIDHLKIKSSANSTDMYMSIDSAVHKLKEQLLRYKDKIQDHYMRSPKTQDMNVNVFQNPVARGSDLEEVNADIEEESRRRLEDGFRPHHIVKSETRPIKNLTNDEAIMKLELSGDTFLIFLCEDDQKIKVIYRRNDGNYGIIEPE